MFGETFTSSLTPFVDVLLSKDPVRVCGCMVHSREFNSRWRYQLEISKSSQGFLTTAGFVKAEDKLTQYHTTLRFCHYLRTGQLKARINTNSVRGLDSCPRGGHGDYIRQ